VKKYNRNPDRYRIILETPGFGAIYDLDKKRFRTCVLSNDLYGGWNFGEWRPLQDGWDGLIGVRVEK